MRPMALGQKCSKTRRGQPERASNDREQPSLAFSHNFRNPGEFRSSRSQRREEYARNVPLLVQKMGEPVRSVSHLIESDGGRYIGIVFQVVVCICISGVSYDCFACICSILSLDKKEKML